MVDLPQVAEVRGGKDLTLLPVGSQAYERSVIPFYDWYFSDSWHMSKSLTLTWGLGYVIQMPPYEFDGNQAIPVDAADQPLSVQDYLSAKKNAALNGQVYNPVVGYANNPNVGAGLKYPYDPVYNQFSPRLAVAWNPQASSGLLGKFLGQGKTVIRAGYGRIYGRLNGVELLLLPLLGVGPIQPVTCPGASMTGQCLGGNNVTPATAFRIGVDGTTAPLAPVAKNLPQPDFPAINDAPAADLMSLDKHFQPNRTDNVTFSIQREVNKNSTIEAGYIGRLIRNEATMTDLDAVPYMMTLNGQQFSQAYAALYTQLQNNVPGNSVKAEPWFEAALGGPTSTFCAAYSSCTAAVASSSMKTYVKESSVTDLWNAMSQQKGWILGRTNISSTPGYQMTALGLADSVGFGNYNAAFVTFRMRDWHGLTALSNFTWGRSLGIGAFTQASGTYTLLDPYNIDNNYGPNGFDIRFQYNLAMSYAPTWYASQKGIVGHIVGGWNIAPLFTAQSGVPLGIYDGNQGSCSGGGCAFGSVAAGGVSSFGTATYGSENMQATSPYTGGTAANYNDHGSGGVGTNNGAGVNMFANPATVLGEFRDCTLGIDQSCSGYANIRGMPRWNLDASLTKDIGIWKEGRVGAQFNFLFTNVLNHVAMNNPSLDVSSPTTFGRILSQINIPRQMEFGLRIHF